MYLKGEMPLNKLFILKTEITCMSSHLFYANCSCMTDVDLCSPMIMLPDFSHLSSSLHVLDPWMFKVLAGLPIE